MLNFVVNMRHLAELITLIGFAFLSYDHAIARAPQIRIRIVSTPPAEARVIIEGSLEASSDRWSFVREYAGVKELGKRIISFSAIDADGKAVDCRQLSPGIYAAQRPAMSFRAEIDLTAPARDTDGAHVSWLGGERAVLMLGDLVPNADWSNRRAAVSVELALPADWTIASTARRRADGRFDVPNVETALFVAGRNLRVRSERAAGIDISLVAIGHWPFTIDDAMKTIVAVLGEHRELFGGVPGDARALIVLTAFPRPTGAQRWSAETRKSTVLLLQQSSNSAVADLSLLGVNLAHELLHLWLPNALRLSGSYDWFYEGFTLYQAMRAGVKLRQLTFSDYLGAIGRAYDAYQAASQSHGEFSLIEASERRWSGQARYVYNKGLLVALLCDLMLRSRSQGRDNLDRVYRDLFQQFGQDASASEDGNDAAIKALQRAGAPRDLTQGYVENGTRIDLGSALEPFGLVVSRVGARWVVGVAPQLTEAQQKILRQLGYNAPSLRERQLRERLKKKLK